MTQSQADVEELAEAYRRAMLAGRSALADDVVEQKILQAMVASSAADTRVWVQRSLPRGDQAAASLDTLLPALQEGNRIGQTLAAAKVQALKQARAVALSVILHATWPLWVGGVVAALVGAFSLSRDAGEATGQLLLPLVIGGTAS